MIKINNVVWMTVMLVMAFLGNLAAVTLTTVSYRFKNLTGEKVTLEVFRGSRCQMGKDRVDLDNNQEHVFTGFPTGCFLKELTITGAGAPVVYTGRSTMHEEADAGLPFSCIGECEVTQDYRGEIKISKATGKIILQKK